eukprot:scaffold15885_cov127-Isochrysis_galbana.AAC.3
MAWRVGRTHRGGHGALHGGKPSHSFAKLGGRLAVQIEEGVTEALSLLYESERAVGAHTMHNSMAALNCRECSRHTLALCTQCTFIRAR